MSGPTVSYRAVLRVPHLLPAFAAASTVRLSYGTTPLALLFTAQRSTGSFATAGLVTGAYALTTFALPLKSRLADTYGLPRVLLALGLAHPVALLGLLAVTVALPGSVPPLVAAAVLAGLAVPPASSAMRAIWSSATEPGAARQRAFSLDAVTEEVTLAVGPALTGTLVALRGPQLAVLVGAAAALVGSVTLAAGRAARAQRDGTARGPLRFGAGPLRLAAFRPVLVAALGVGLALSMVEIAVAGRAQNGAAGYLMAALSVGSALGGLLWGRRHHTRSHHTHLVGLLTAAAVGYAAASLAPNLVVLAAVLLVAGLPLAPTFVVAYLVADQVVPAGHRTEGTTWVNTANNVGVAIGGPLAGVLLTSTSVATTQALAGAAALVPALLLLTLGARHRPGVSRRSRTAPRARRPDHRATARHRTASASRGSTGDPVRSRTRTGRPNPPPAG